MAGSAWRVADRGLELIRVLGGRPRQGDASRVTLPPGTMLQRDGRCAVTALAPLGRLDAMQLTGLLQLVERTNGLRVSPWRTVTIPDLHPGDVHETIATLARLGLVLDPDSGWFGLTACAGLGACSKARIDVRAAAARRASQRDSRSGLEHWSACPRRCGKPTAASTDIAAEDDLVMLSSGEAFENVDAALRGMA
jgi:precorrin-3B synthase